MPLRIEDYSDEALTWLLRILRAKKTPRGERFKAACFILERKFPIPRFAEPIDALRPIHVTIGVMGSAQVAVNGHDLGPADPGSPLRTDGLQLRADGGNGSSA